MLNVHIVILAFLLKREITGGTKSVDRHLLVDEYAEVH